MKKFKKLEGKKYTFKKNSLAYNRNEYEDTYNYILKKVLNTKKIENKFNSIINNLELDDEKEEVKQNLFQIIVENTAKSLNIDDTKIYNIKTFNKLLIKKTKNNEITKNEKLFIKLLKENNYEEIRKKGIFNPIELLRAIYLYVLMEA